MSNNNNNKDPIEELFKQKAEHYDIPFNESDWLRLEKRLDLLDKQYAYRKKMRLIAAASILILSLLGYFTFENRIKINQIARELGGNPVPEVQRDTEHNDTPDGQNSQPGVREKLNGVIAADDSTQDTRDSSLLSLQEERTSKRADSEEPVQNQQNGNVTETGRNSFPHLTANSKGAKLFIPELACPSCALALSGVKEEPESLTRFRIEPPATDTDNPMPVYTSGNTSSAMLSSAERMPQEKKPRAAISLVMGPDLSTVESISSFYSPGYKLGIAVEYRLGTNLSVTTGIIQSEVRYRAHGGDYKPPTGYWTDGIVPYETIGECILLDIPINLKYNFLNFTRSRFYATAGLSSYIMLNEDYRFNYDRDDTGLVQGWSEETGTRHWMSNMGLSIGYELDVHSNWSIRAEPFIKTPLREVGWGNVKLYSLGSFISINYKL